MANWFNLITKEMKKNNDWWDCLEATTLDDETMFQEFEQSYSEFVLWTRTHMYFSRDYEGKSIVKSVERNP